MSAYRGARRSALWTTTATSWILLLGTVCLLLPCPAAAQQRELHLTLREATAFALQGNLDLQIAGLTPRIQEARLAERQGIFNVEGRASVRVSDTRLLDTSTTFRDGEVPINYIDRTPNQTPQGPTPRTGFLVGQDDSQEQQVALGISQLTPYGGTYEVEVSETRLDTRRLTTATAERNRELGLGGAENASRNEFYRTELGVRATQPLLRNFGSLVTKNQILIAQNNVSISREEFRQRVINITSQVQQVYWELVFRQQDLEVRRQQRALAQKLLDQIRKQVAVGTLAPLEAIQAETNISRAEERILIAENALRASEDRLKRVMNLSFTGELANVVLIPVDAPNYVTPAIVPEEQIRQALDSRPDLVQTKLALENQNITLIFDKNQVLPRLDLEASFRFNGINQDLDTSLGEIRPTERYRWEVGMTFRYPLANTQAKSRVEQSRLGIRQQMLRIQNLEENIIAEVRLAVRDVLTNSQRVQTSRVSRRLVEKQLEAEEKKLQVGLATVFTVLQFQDVVSVERSNEINTLTEYLRALVRLEEAKSTLLNSYNIVLQADGPSLQQ